MRCYTADKLSEKYNNDINHLYLLFLYPHLERIQKVNKIFQSNSAEITKILDDLCVLIASTANAITTGRENFDPLSSSIEDNLHPNPYLGYQFEQKMQDLQKNNACDAELEKNIRKRCTDFLIDLVKSLRRRMPKNISVLQKIKLFNLSNLNHHKETLIPLLREMAKPAHMIEKIETQWQNLHCINWPKANNTLNFWTAVYTYENSGFENPYKELATFVLSLLTLPFSNAEVERLFSQMNLIKTKTRNRMQNELLNGIILVRSELKRSQTCCKDYPIPYEILKNVAKLHIAASNESETIDMEGLMMGELFN